MLGAKALVVAFLMSMRHTVGADSPYACCAACADEPVGGRSPTSVYDTPQDQGAAIKQLLKENQNLKLKARLAAHSWKGQARHAFSGG